MPKNVGLTALTIRRARADGVGDVSEASSATEGVMQKAHPQHAATTVLVLLHAVNVLYRKIEETAHIVFLVARRG